MVSNNKKRTYEPPRIYEIEVDMDQARGQSGCTNGGGVVSLCDNGGGATGGNCSNGGTPGAYCDNGGGGTAAPQPCTMGGRYW